jgi:hypothetical protein
VVEKAFFSAHQTTGHRKVVVVVVTMRARLLRMMETMRETLGKVNIGEGIDRREFSDALALISRPVEASSRP